MNTNLSINLADLDEYLSNLIAINVPNTWDSWDEYQASLQEDYEEVLLTNAGWTEFEDSPWA